MYTNYLLRTFYYELSIYNIFINMLNGLVTLPVFRVSQYGTTSQLNIILKLNVETI